MADPIDIRECVDAFDRLESALKAIRDDDVGAIVRAWPGFAYFAGMAGHTRREMAALRDYSPCKLWEHDGGVYCAVHRHYENARDFGDSERCKKARVLPPTAKSQAPAPEAAPEGRGAE